MSLELSPTQPDEILLDIFEVQNSDLNVLGLGMSCTGIVLALIHVGLAIDVWTQPPPTLALSGPSPFLA